jgi:transposase
MRKTPKFSPEGHERAVRVVNEYKGEYLSLWAATESSTPKMGCVPQNLLECVKQAEVDSGEKKGVTTDWAERIPDLEREV